MAVIKEIYVEASFTKNLGNYQSFKPTAGVTVTIEQGDDVQKVLDKSWDLVGAEIEKQLALFEEEKKGTLKRGI